MTTTTRTVIFPRFKNGYRDDGKVLSRPGKACPNCGSVTGYRETVSLELCTACGLRCDYWGGGANAVYEAMLDRRGAAEEEAAAKAAGTFEGAYGQGYEDEEP
jgi:ribosomal protein L37AE/L43A